MIKTLSKRFMSKVNEQGLHLETGNDPAPTTTPLFYYAVCLPSGEPIASAWEVEPQTSAQEIEQHLLAQMAK